MKILNGLDLQNQKIVSLADGSAPTDAVNRQQLDNAVRGLIIKEAVRVASTTAITIASPGTTIDGVTMVVNDRVLEKDNAVASARGIYIWNGAATPMTRALDADSGTELRPGTTVFVTEGTVNADRQYLITSDVAIVIGTTAQTWSAFGGGTSYTASNGVLLTGANFTGIVAAAGGLIVGASGFSVDTAIVSRKLSGVLGNGALTSIAVTHNLGTKDVGATLRQVSDDAMVMSDWVATDVNNVTFTFAVAPATGALRWTIQG